MPLRMIAAGAALPIVLPSRPTPETVSELTAPEAELLKQYGETLLIVATLSAEPVTPFSGQFRFRAE